MRRVLVGDGSFFGWFGSFRVGQLAFARGTGFAVFVVVVVFFFIAGQFNNGVYVGLGVGGGAGGGRGGGGGVGGIFIRQGQA